MRVSDPATYDGNFHTTQRDADEPQEPLRTANCGSSRIFIAANFINTLELAAPLEVSDCPANTDFIVADRQDDCKQALRTAMNTCE
jgi:hypothetical protein